VLAVDPDDLLPVDQAFPLTVSAPSADRIEVGFRVAEGYYLYRHRMAAEPADAGFVASGPLRLPPGKRYTDEFFGEVETYRERVTGVLPGRAADGARAATIRVKFQGCADIGVCYPPQVRTVTVALPGATGRGVAADPAPAGGALFGGAAGGGAGLLGSGEPLPPEQAFQVEAIAGDGNSVLLRMTPARGYYLYRDKTSVALDAGPGVSARCRRRRAGRRARHIATNTSATPSSTSTRSSWRCRCGARMRGRCTAGSRSVSRAARTRASAIRR
jgi:thioredoxin:protein disulfide reductase